MNFSEKIIKLANKFSQKYLIVESSNEKLYHGSPKKLKILIPQKEHGDPRVPSAIFASPSKTFALAYAGNKWGDRDIEQSFRGGNKPKMFLREMRPNAFKEIYNTQGYLYQVPSESFQAMKGRRSSFEVVSYDSVKPIKMEIIHNILKELKQNPFVELYTYDPNNPDTYKAIKRQIKRMKEMTTKDAKEYRQWVFEKATPEIKKMFKEESLKQDINI